MSASKSRANSTDVITAAIGPIEDAGRTVAVFMLQPKSGEPLVHGVVYRASRDEWFAICLGRFGMQQPPLDVDREAWILATVGQMLGEDDPQRTRRVKVA